MKFLFRIILMAFAFANAAVCAAASFPERPIRLVVPFPAGGTTDMLGRILAAHLSEELGKPVIVDNRPGAGGVIGADVVAKSPADGYTLLLGSPASQAINALLYKHLPYDAQKDFTPVALFASTPNILVVNPKLPVKSVAELVRYAKEHPGALNMGSAGNGTTNHLSGELFNSMAGVKILHVPYKGSGPAMSDLLANQVQLMFDNLPGSLPHVKAGRLRALAVTSSVRSPVLPDVPTMAEAGIPGYEADVRIGVMGPRGMPPAVVSRLSTAITKIANDKKFQSQLLQQGATAIGVSPAEFAEISKLDAAKWGKVIRESRVTLD
ncbi:tripartite tricarboxylate transporter substrate binding protein (plasmid) [Cupriavidus pinatubonensis]|uniref:tripartite tricarboxylate transporter substrate binding protein n=1 Tax=Cupriavidus pinatubonensis TaxID=248026 RepID=UPI001C730E39|nr:tripartite tricarboxylate transporter substrate binding protein [Cupriavidus pinatubonensis]QYY33882.1 tripartite tricarboxylate transporter substrate binding protein [Cupriavidus pinatubonensis]